ncbi:MAG: hypothetical protein J6A89_05525 [Clostridia bacterium]|nr:hypothetical protein [Clostridia bacterium]
MNNIRLYFFLLLIYSITGWLIEVILGIIQNKKFVNRGFMIGPYCPIYGIGGVLITIFLQKYANDPFILFGMAILICGVLEYATSYIMEKVFKARWWDYSKKKFNINGRVCLETIIPFGLLGCFIIYISNPFIKNSLAKVPENILQILFIILFTVYVIDFIISFFVISRLRRTVKEVNKNETYDNTEEITKKVKEILTNKTILDRRLINAFPKVSIQQVKQKIKEKTDQVKENVSKAKAEATEKIKESAIKVKEGTLKVKEETTEKIKEYKKKIN